MNRLNGIALAGSKLSIQASLRIIMAVWGDITVAEFVKGVNK